MVSGGLLRQTWRSGSCRAVPEVGAYTHAQKDLPGGGGDTDWHHGVFI